MLIASINRRLTLALTICSLMALLALGGAEHFRDIEYAAIQKNFQAATASDQLQHQAHKLNEAARGYVSTGQEALLTRYRSESRTFEAFDAQFGHLEHLQLSTDEMQSLLAIYDAISSAIVTQRQAINLARNQDFSAAIALLYSSDYEQALKQIEDPAEQFVRLVQTRFQTEQLLSHQKALLGRIVAMGLGGVNMILLLTGLLFFYRQRVIAPISQLVSDLKQVQDNPNASFQNQDLTNEIGDVVRAIQSYHTTAREVKALRWAADSKAAILASCQDCLSIQTLAHHLASSLARALGCGAIAIHMRHIRTGRYHQMGQYGGTGETTHRAESESPLIRQAISEGQIIELRDLPPDYMLIRSGTGEASPQILYLFPLLRGKDGLAVIEIACFTPLTPLQMRLVSETGSALAPLIERQLVSDLLTPDGQTTTPATKSFPPTSADMPLE